MADEPPSPTAGDQAEVLEFLGSGGRIRTRESVRLVVNRDGHFAQLVLVLPSVVGAEQQLGSTRELDPHIGLSAAAIAAIYC